MPDPKKYKTRDDFLKVCIPVRMKEGDTQEQAIGACYGMWEGRNSKKKAKSAMNDLDKTLPAELQGIELALPDDESDGITKGSAKEGGDGGMAGAAGAEPTKVEPQTTQHGERSMADALTKDDIRKEVEAIFASKEAQKQVETRIATAEAEKAALAQELNDAKTANQSLKSELDAAKAALATKTTEFETLSKEKEEAEGNADKVSKELAEIRAEQVATKRSAELAEAKLLLPEGEKRNAQLAKVKSMTDEAFASYKAELAEVAEQAAASAKPAQPPAAEQTTPPPAAAPEKAEASKKPADAEGTELEKAIAKIDGIDAPEVSQAQALQHAVAAASEQVQLDADSVSVYAQM